MVLIIESCLSCNAAVPKLLGTTFSERNAFLIHVPNSSRHYVYRFAGICSIIQPIEHRSIVAEKIRKVWKPLLEDIVNIEHCILLIRDDIYSRL